ncbi:hypothetical protein H0S58_09915 [Acinetobacter sp. TTH0-4]|uniref:hypothetical protein n=1 Tax=Acinetobacter sp. TTH0-4 TaxID=1646498 RepID=UPI0018A007A7|nr:hypothetical protein [Acinetobacter sp. TTH0-4]QPF37313.1 hypothetical protein H0S58_09915 [Acinetobacter sp. TTH0-4]
MLKNKAKIPSNLRGFFMSFKPKKNRLVQSDGINWKLIKQIDDGGNGLIWAAHQELNLSEICVFKFIPPATVICAELAGDFHLGYARQLTDKSSLLFDLAF